MPCLGSVAREPDNGDRRLGLAVSLTPEQTLVQRLRIAYDGVCAVDRRPAQQEPRSRTRGIGAVRERSAIVSATRTYSTRFELSENPISEGGAWRNGGRDGLDWSDVLTSNGLAYGAKTRAVFPDSDLGRDGQVASGLGPIIPTGDYDDPTALLSGLWGRNQAVRATVFSRNQTDEYFQEVEIRLRSAIEPRICTGYEVLWRCSQAERAYVAIVRWNGPVADFTSLESRFGSAFGVKHGDVIEARMVGSLITAFVNGAPVISVTDNTFGTGSPGIGFNFGVGDTNVDHGLTSLDVESWDD